MQLVRLIVSNFRNISLADIAPDPGFNVIFGPNGSGKTSVLEAISYLALGRSFRGFNYQYLIKRGENAFEIFSAVSEEDLAPKVQLGIKRLKGAELEISINGDRGQRLLDLISHICVQVIHPQGVELVTGLPELRRGFVDWGVFYLYQDFKKFFFSYKKTLMQRNRLLKIGAPRAEFAPWDLMLADLSSKINAMRTDYLTTLQAELGRIINEFLPDLDFDFYLSPGYPKDLDPSEALSRALERDQALGFTSVGCHRADLKIKLKGVAASSLLSRGQLKLLVCAMRLAQASVLRQSLNKTCIFLIDDFNSELDEHSQQVLMQELLDCQSQVFITNISPPAAGSIPKTSKFFRMDNGVMREDFSLI